MEKKYFEQKGTRYSYTEKGEGEAVVLLHGFCGSSSYWNKLLPLLPNHYRVIAPDLRGHGSSEAPDGDYTMEVFAEDLAQLLQHLKVEQAIVLGHSLGGYVTLAFAERYPGMLKAFGLIHSTAYPDSDAGKEGRIKGMETIREKGLPVFIGGLIPKLFAPEHVKSMPEEVREATAIGESANPDGAIRTLEGMRTRPDRNAVLEDASIPVLLVAGVHDQIIPLDRAFSVSGGRIVQRQIEAAGHMSMVEAPEKLANVIVEFITNV
ncbi:alpha/beta fold hydrolase [Paenibacillus radicis (ex Xue et al. 2023)]|uniref:Alpha/beta hydrolase n=1 Tax=Paenibacillus radicis (ex Xue et al. 2023) TaxID=2972489 RepID=A0ABT1YDZ0_9BACL|nr:alpha/beta hydrolase [Paenibacillus radicis (ex Xue et al. 2023)]MCR8631399.1 alpha/beta hydrolase [Paenibacillus radicis (ex Xue et al. 2023)]